MQWLFGPMQLLQIACNWFAIRHKKSRPEGRL